MVPNSIFAILISATLVSLVQAEVFTAVSEVEPLLATRKKIIDDLDGYIKKEEHRLFILKKYLDLYSREHAQAMEDIPNYLGNPINAFTLIKRLTTDLDFIEDTMKKIGTVYLKNITDPDIKYPTLEDLAGAAEALSRLQDTYNLKVDDLAEGILNGVSYSASMSAGDCYELGRALYNEKDYKNALAWMLQALTKYSVEKDTLYPFDKADILEHISVTHYFRGDTKTALEWIKKLLEFQPNRQEESKLGKILHEISHEDEQRKLHEDFKALCRGDFDIPQEIAKKLTCRYLTENHPFLKLAPIKVEQRYIDPDVFVFHDVISDDEIEFIKKIATLRFERAYVVNTTTFKSVLSRHRVSKSSWLKNNESEMIAKISRRISDFTGLSMETAEHLQVVNYGIGGHYGPHFDFGLKHENPFELYGNRIATVLFYMSDVAQGGATVFTELGLSVFPIKGAALFWMNLHPSGEGDTYTLHAACPVLRGSKWVSNKWIRLAGQMLLKPCTLEYQQEGMVRHIPNPVPKSFR